MASYTMQLRTYIEKWSQDDPNLSNRERVEIGRKKLFDFDYPIFDEEYKQRFETNFIRRFYMREIGFETEELFKFQLETWLMINMPYFNKLFESELIKFDPLLNSRTEKLHQKNNEKEQASKMDGTSNSTSNQKGKSSGTSNEDNFERDLTSDNPDSRLAITTQDGKGVIEYASQIGESKENNKTTTQNDSNVDVTSNDVSSVSSSADQNEVEYFLEKRVGKIGFQTYSKMLMEFRETFIRIENQIHQEMQQLFMLVY